MDYKNILEGTRPFFQGLPQPTAQVPGPPSASTMIPQPLSSPLKDSREVHHSHHLLNHQQHSLMHHRHIHSSNPSLNTSISTNSVGGTNCSIIKNPNHNSNNINSSSSGGVVDNRESSPTVISKINANSSSGERSRSLDRLGHLHGHRSTSPHDYYQHKLLSTTKNKNVSSSSPTKTLPLALPQDGAALIRSKFEEGLGATLSQMYSGGQAGPYGSTLNLSRATPGSVTSGGTLLTTVTQGLLIDSGLGENINILSERQTTIIHSSTTKSSKKSDSKPPNPTSSGTNGGTGSSNMVGVRRESPLDLSVKTVRQSADSSTSSLALDPTVGLNNGSRSLSNSGASTPNLLSNPGNPCLSNNNSVIGSVSGRGDRDSVNTSVITPVVNSTTNIDHCRSKSREKELQGGPNQGTGSRTTTPIRYPSPHHNSRQQSPSSSSLHQLPQQPPMHQRVANLNLSIPTPPPRTGSGSSVASAHSVPGHPTGVSSGTMMGNIAASQQQMANAVATASNPLPHQVQSNHHHLLTHYTQHSSPGTAGNSSRVHHNVHPSSQSHLTYQNSFHQHPHFGGIQQNSGLPGPVPASVSQSSSTPSVSTSNAQLSHVQSSRPGSVIPPYNPPLGAGLPAPYHHPVSSAYSLHPHQHHHHATYPQYHPHFPAQPGQSAAVGPGQSPTIHSSYYPNYPHLQQQQQPTQQQQQQPPPPSSKSSQQITPTSNSSANNSSTSGSTQSIYAQTQSKLSHPTYATQQSQSLQQNPSTPPSNQIQGASPYYHHPTANYYGPPQAVTPQSQLQSNARPGVTAPHQPAQQHPGGYPSHHLQHHASPNTTTPYPHYSHITYPTYPPPNQRTPVTHQSPHSQQPQGNYPGHPACVSANFQSHPGLRPTTPTGPPPPQTGAAVYAPPSQNQYHPLNSNDKSAPSNKQPQTGSAVGSPMKPPDAPPVTLPKVKGSSRKNVLSMIRNTVESRMQEKQEKEKFQFNHQTWNFHGRTFNTSLPPLNNNNKLGNGNLTIPGSHLGNSLSLGSAGTGSGNSSSSSTNTTGSSLYGYSKYESSSLGGGSDMNNSTPGILYNNTTPLPNNSGGSGESGSGGSNSDLSPLNRIRTKAEKKQLFPNLLSQIEQENSHKEAERKQQNSHIFSRQGSNSLNSTSVFDFKEDDDEYRPKIIIPQPPPPSCNLVAPTQKKPRSPKKTDGVTRRNSLPKKGAKSSSLSSTIDSSIINHGEKNEDKSMSMIEGEGGTSLGQSIQATKAVTKIGAVESIDAFWAACDSFLDDLQSNPNSIKSRRGGLWQKLKSKSKASAANPKTSNSGTVAVTGQPPIISSNKVGRGVRIRKNSSEEDSDFEINEEKSDEEEDEEDSESNSDDSDDSDEEDANSNKSAGSSNIKLKRNSKKNRGRVIDSDEEVSEGDKSDGDSEEGKTKKKSVESSKKKNKKDSEGKTKAESSDVETKKGKGNKSSSGKVESGGGVGGGSKSDGESKERKTKSHSRRRRSTRKRKTVIGTRSDAISDLDDDEDATSRSSIGSEASESEHSDSESFLHSLDSDDSDRSSGDSDESEDSEEDSDADQLSLTSSGSRKRKKVSISGSGPAKKLKKGRSSSKRKKNRRNTRLKNKEQSTRSKSKEIKKSSKRSGSKNDEDDESFELKGGFKSRSKGSRSRKRRLPKRNCAPIPGNGKLKDISGESGEDGEGGSSGEEWIMRGDLTKKKRKVVFGDGSDFHRPGWEEELIDFKKKLRMPQKLIQVSKPSSLTMSPTQSAASSVIGDKSSAITTTLGTPMLQVTTKDEPSPAKSAKENKIPTGTKGGKRHSEKSPVKEKLHDSSTIISLDKESITTTTTTTSGGKKIKGRPPKSANLNSTPQDDDKPPLLEPMLPVKTKGVKISEKGKGKSKSKGGLMLTSSEKKSDTSESPLDDPTIEKAVERMKAAAKKDKAAIAAAAAANAPPPTLTPRKSETLDCKGKPSPGKISGGGKKGSNKSVSIVKEEDLPLPSPLGANSSPITSVTNTNSSPAVVPTPPTTVKKGFRRNKFKSGFDYIRKKKKIPTNPDGSPLPPPPKRVKTVIEKNTTVEDIQVEIRGWVLNKGHGETALHRAGRLGYPDVAAYCLEHEVCSPNCKDNAGYTPLHETCIKGNLEVAKILLAYGANPSAAAPGGIRPLHEACENGHVELVRLLISFGADPTLTTYAGQSPMELAEPHVNVRLLLEQHINDVLGKEEKPWEFRGSGSWTEDPHEIGFDATADPPPSDPSLDDLDGFEFESSEIPLPPLYKLKEKNPYYVLLNDVLNYLCLPKDKFLKSNPTAETVELNSNDFLEDAHCCHLLGEKFNLNSSSDLLTLIKYDDRIKKMLNIESCFVK